MKLTDRLIGTDIIWSYYTVEDVVCDKKWGFEPSSLTEVYAYVNSDPRPTGTLE